MKEQENCEVCDGEGLETVQTRFGPACIDRVLPYKAARDKDDEKHVHPLQLDVIERTVILRSNPGENVLTPFMGVGSEVYGASLSRTGEAAPRGKSFAPNSRRKPLL